MAKELPYFKFEPNKWENGNIQMLSREDKGLFIDLCSMYWARLGDVPLKLVVQKLCGGNAVALESLCEENIIQIIDENIFIKYLSEQLSEFEDTSKQNRKNAKEGWEKRRKQKAESDRNATASNPQSESSAIREEKRREEEIREEKRREDNEIYLSKREIHKIDFQEIINIFNSVCSELPKVDKISEKRKKLINARIKENSLETLGIVFKKISESDFLSGRKTDFVASFDWVMNPANFLKILEDNYKNRKNGGDKSTEQVFADAMQSPLAKIDFFK